MLFNALARVYTGRILARYHLEYTIYPVDAPRMCWIYVVLLDFDFSLLIFALDSLVLPDAKALF